ncbi:MAG: hypothetical protein DLM61_25725 [Pseudonocardiales bacterium]|nr:MAG: hypothetical protein DLM61_25725 [Pseudonocardiales bacterium]
MVIRGEREEVMPGSLDAEVRLSSRTIRLGSFVATSTRVHQSSRCQLIGAPGRTSSTFHTSRLWTERYWPIGRVVLQLSAAAAMMTQNEGVALLISGIAMMTEIAQDRSTRSR